MSVRSHIRTAPEGCYLLQEGNIQKLWIISKGDILYCTRNISEANPSGSHRIVDQRSCDNSWMATRITDTEALNWIRAMQVPVWNAAKLLKLRIHAPASQTLASQV